MTPWIKLSPYIDTIRKRILMDMSKLFLGCIGFVFVHPALWAKDMFTMNESKAFRREMVELDVGIRNFASAISLADTSSVLTALLTLKESRVSLIPKYKKSMRSVYRKLKSKAYYRYLKTIQTDAHELYKIVSESQKKGADPNWGMVHQKYQNILDNCRSCHLKMIP